MTGTLVASLTATIVATTSFYALATLWAMVGAILCYAQTRPAAARSIGDFIAFISPWRLLNHASARLDLWYIVVQWLVRPVLIAPFVFSAAVAGKCLSPHLLLADEHELAPLSLVPSISLILALIIASDFARFFAHYLAHRVPALWAFHKVHHSAEVLIPPAALRLHPIDELCLFVTLTVANTLVYVVFFSVYRVDMADVTRLGLDAYVALYLLSFNPLRHSHLSLRFGAILEHVLMSPAMHHLHHSCEPCYHGKNLGFALSIWDRIFGTFAPPEPQMTGPLGLGAAQGGAYGTVWALYWTPVLELRRGPVSVAPHGQAPRVTERVSAA